MLETKRSIREGAKAYPYGHLILGLLLASAVATGCQSQAIHASRLPAEYRTASIAGHSKINLGRLTSSGTSNALISPGDLLEVIIASGRDEEKQKPTLARVSNDGVVELPAIGIVYVAGLEPFEASQNIATASIERGIYLKPSVTVSIQSKAVNQITVLGEVDNPGVHELPRNACDLISALGAAGGLSEEASTTIEIIRHRPTILASRDEPNGVKPAAYASLGQGGPPASPQLAQYQSQPPIQSQTIDLAMLSPHVHSDYHLEDRDVVVVHPNEKRLFHVAGLVKKPGQFELPNDQDVHLLDAVAMAGGLDSVVADKVYVIRRVEGQAQPLVIEASLQEAKHNGLENLRLAAGDTVNVEQTPSTVFVDTLTKLFRISMGVTRGTLF